MHAWIEARRDGLGNDNTRGKAFESKRGEPMLTHQHVMIAMGEVRGNERKEAPTSVQQV